MPTRDLKGPPPPDPREAALAFEILVRLQPELDWWPRWRDRGDAGDIVTPPWGGPPPPLTGTSAASLDDRRT